MLRCTPCGFVETSAAIGVKPSRRDVLVPQASAADGRDYHQRTVSETTGVSTGDPAVIASAVSADQGVDRLVVFLELHVVVFHDCPRIEQWVGKDAVYAATLHTHVAAVVDRKN
jgi:hypothetical protein